jgi:hypothetical protein
MTEKSYFCSKYINKVKTMDDLEHVLMHGIVFKGDKKKPGEEDKKVKTKAKKLAYIHGAHGSGSAKMKAEIRRRRANRHK